MKIQKDTNVSALTKKKAETITSLETMMIMIIVSEITKRNPNVNQQIKKKKLKNVMLCQQLIIVILKSMINFK